MQKVKSKHYDMDAEESCTRCKTSFENFGGHRIGIGGDSKGFCEVICPACDRYERIRNYKKTGEMNSSLVMDAVLAQHRFGSKNGFDGIRSEIAAYYRNFKKELLEIAEKNDRITKSARKWEKIYWLGKLQKYYKENSARGHSAQTETTKVLLWGSAGRVLLTLQDRYPAGNKKSKFNGAWITLIFDESADYCRGGVQGYCATVEEAIGLIASVHPLPEVKPDNKVSLL